MVSNDPTFSQVRSPRSQGKRRFEYIVDPPGRYTINYNFEDEPAFETAPTPQDFATENRWFPRSEDTMPDWFRKGLKGTA